MTTKIMTIEITNPISYNMCEHDHNLKKRRGDLASASTKKI